MGNSGGFEKAGMHGGPEFRASSKGVPKGKIKCEDAKVKETQRENSVFFSSSLLTWLFLLTSLPSQCSPQ